MAEKRMFTQKIIDSDPFLDMPLSTQALYFHLNMRADDDGFVNSPKKICRAIGASEDDLRLLFAKRFVIGFDRSGVLVIKHWRMHNTLRKDRYNPTQYQEEYAMLDVKDNKAYTEKPIECLATSWQPNGNQVATQYSIDKNSIVEDSVEKDSLSDSDEPEPPAPKNTKPSKHKYGEYSNVLLTDDELEKLKAEYPDYLDRIERLSSYVASTGKSYKSHYATIRNWARKDKEQQPQTVVKSNNKFNNFNQRKYDAEFFENLEKRNRESYKPADPERVQALQERLKQKYGKGKNNG